MSFFSTANRTYSINVVMLITYEHGNDNIVNGYFYKFISVLYIELFTSFAGVEFYVTGCGISGSNCRMFL